MGAGVAGVAGVAGRGVGVGVAGRGGAPKGSAGTGRENGSAGTCRENENGTVGAAGAAVAGGGVAGAAGFFAGMGKIFSSSGRLGGAAGEAEAGGAPNFDIGIGAVGGNAGPGAEAAGTEEMEPRAGVAGAGAVWRGEAGATGFALFPTEKTNPSPFPSNGLVISVGTSMLFCAGRRTNKAGLSCKRISFNGSDTAMRSLSPSGVKAYGADSRMSPNGTFTTPWLS